MLKLTYNVKSLITFFIGLCQFSAGTIWFVSLFSGLLLGKTIFVNPLLHLFFGIFLLFGSINIFSALINLMEIFFRGKLKVKSLFITAIVTLAFSFIMGVIVGLLYSSNKLFFQMDEIFIYI